MRCTGAENSAENAPEAGENGTPENGDPEAANAPEGAGEDDGQPPQITPSKSVSESGFVKYAYFGENMIRYTKDGASYIDGAGKTVWTQSFEMKTPVINVNGDYAVIADQQGNQLYICSTAGCTGVAKTQLPITKAAVSSRGITAAVVEDSSACYIFYFKKDGEELGINIKVLDYSEHALTSGSGAQAASYIHMMDQDRKRVTYGVGISSNITRASFRGIFSAVNRLFY